MSDDTSDLGDEAAEENDDLERTDLDRTFQEWLDEIRQDVGKRPDQTVVRRANDLLRGKEATDPYADERNRLDIADRKTILTIKRRLARWAGGFAAGQLVLADIAFFTYSGLHDWQIPPEVMITWISGTVVESVGIVYIIARHVFPNRDEHPPKG